MIKIFNPRTLLREGSKELLLSAAAGDDVFIRAGSLAKKGRPMIKAEHENSIAAYGAEAAGKVFKLVEVPEAELEAWQTKLDAQTDAQTDTEN